MLVMPADHVISPDHVFQDALRLGAELVEEKPDRLVTFGIRPSYPAESFGYIERDQPVVSSAGSVYHVKQFREKPSAAVASQYLEAGSFYWNSGIFVWRARTIIDQLSRHEPEMQSTLREIVAAAGSDDFDEVFASEFRKIEGKSIDYAVMERAQDVVVIEAPFGWDDVGSWQALSRLCGTDDEGNTVDARHLGINTRGTIVRGPGDHLIVTLGLEDCIVVHTDDATLVARKADEESVREVVRMLEQRGWKQHL
jgi:mannose-1-phosphate guanylyltransferase